MFFSDKKRVDEDLEKIRFSNLPEDKQREELARKEKQKKKIDAVEFEKNDYKALLLAAILVVGPYILAFFGILGVFFWLIYSFFLN